MIQDILTLHEDSNSMSYNSTPKFYSLKLYKRKSLSPVSNERAWRVEALSWTCGGAHKGRAISGTIEICHGSST